MQKIRVEFDRNEDRFRQLSDKVDKNKMQRWQQNFRGFRQEKKEEAAMLRKRWIVAWRRWWNSSSLWEQFDHVSGVLQEIRAKTLLRRCQKKKEEEGTVRTNKSKAKPVRICCCQRQAGAMKALQRVV